MKYPWAESQPILAQLVPGRLILHAFGHGLEAEVMREIDGGTHDHFIFLVVYPFPSTKDLSILILATSSFWI